MLSSSLCIKKRNYYNHHARLPAWIQIGLGSGLTTFADHGKLDHLAM